jgi:hypothetical protein
MRFTALAVQAPPSFGRSEPRRRRSHMGNFGVSCVRRRAPIADVYQCHGRERKLAEVRILTHQSHSVKTPSRTWPASSASRVRSGPSRGKGLLGRTAPHVGQGGARHHLRAWFEYQVFVSLNINQACARAYDRADRLAFTASGYAADDRAQRCFANRSNLNRSNLHESKSTRIYTIATDSSASAESAPSFSRRSGTGRLNIKGVNPSRHNYPARGIMVSV